MTIVKEVIPNTSLTVTIEFENESVKLVELINDLLTRYPKDSGCFVLSTGVGEDKTPVRFRKGQIVTNEEYLNSMSKKIVSSAIGTGSTFFIGYSIILEV